MLWFSQITQIEREISFRTEQGLYYSYFKQLVEKNLFEGIEELMHDNKTEHGHSINIFKNFNIYQELFLSILYRLFNFKDIYEPIVFYTKFIFLLQTLSVAGLYLTSWKLTGNWLCGVLTVAFYFCNLSEATRVNNAVSLRECFSLPFLFCQMAIVTAYLKMNSTKCIQILCALCLFLTTFLYTITWQFAQFISLCQVLSLFGLAVVNMIPIKKVGVIMCVHIISLMCVYAIQFGNTFIIASVLLSILPISLTTLIIQNFFPCHGICKNIFRVLIEIVFVLLSTFILNSAIKYSLNMTSDEHILKFLKAKLGFGDIRDFESNLYLCNSAFDMIELNTIYFLMERLLLPTYFTVLFISLAKLVYCTLDNWDNVGNTHNESHKQDFDNRRSTLFYHTVQSIFFGVLALFILRLKCLWVPHMCVLASVGFFDTKVWNFIFNRFFLSVTFVRYSCFCLILSALIYKSIPLIKQLKDLHEFWDPDTVELMDWIRSSSSEYSVFAGSMQLMAAVKLCTGRPIANHPHFEEKWLRDRTKLIYQIYSRKEPDVIKSMLTEIGVNYIILEDSICFAKSDGRCKLTDIMDLYDGFTPENGRKYEGLVAATSSRFCKQITLLDVRYNQFFKLVFKNKTFRVYEVL